MDNIITWIIIIAFYAPMHFVLPVLILFITGTEEETVRKVWIRRAVIDSSLSMLLAFVVAIALVQYGHMSWAMLALLASMPLPIIRVLTRKNQKHHQNSE